MTIGIPGWLVGPNSFGIGLSYFEFLKRDLHCDDIRILSPSSPIWSDLDLLVLPGGADINPSRYGEEPSFYTDKPDLIKEYFDTHILPRYIEKGVGILGICRGAQAIAVHFGEILIQNMYHETNKTEDPYTGVHYINVLAETSKKVKVNSRHHQSVFTPSSTSVVKVLATHKDKHYHVEVIRIEGRPIIGVQYHIEDCDESSCRDYTMSLINKILLKK